MVVEVPRHHVGADALAGQRGRERRGQADGVQRRVDAQGDPRGHEVVGQAQLVGPLARQHERQSFGLGHRHHRVLDAIRPGGEHEDVAPVVQVRRHGRQQGGQVRLAGSRARPIVHGLQPRLARVPTDPRDLRGDAPLLDAWLRFQEERPTPFTIPGHKQRLDLVGDVVAGDVPLYAGLDTMKLSLGVLAEAESRAARLWGADVCRFSVGGATHANQAIALALGGDGDKVVVSRTLHRSVLLGLVLAGLRPVWVRPDVDPATGLPLGVAPATVARALEEHPDARAVLVGDPSYVGTVGDVAGLAEAAHAHGVPLVVDAAWAAHFGFHPDLPPHALQAGADAMVVSAHKTLPAWSQAALVLARTARIDAARLDAGVEATATTSPAGAILASTDAARALLERDGEALLGAAISATRSARERLADVAGLVVLDGPGSTRSSSRSC